MTDINLTPVNCAGDTCHMRLGRDPDAVDAAGPGALRGALFHDDTIDCGAEGIFVARCDPNADLDAAQKPSDVDSGNMLRKVEDCGLIVVAPQVKAEAGDGDANLIEIPNTGNSVVAQTYNYTNNDTVDHLVTLHTKVLTVAQKMSANGSPCLLVLNVFCRSNINQIEGVGDIFLGVTLSSSANVGVRLRDSRYFTSMWRVPPGQLLTVTYDTQTLFFDDVDTDPANQNGFQVRTMVSRIEQMRSS